MKFVLMALIRLRYSRKHARSVGRVLVKTDPGVTRDTLCTLFDEKTVLIGHYAELFASRNKVPQDLRRWAGERTIVLCSTRQHQRPYHDGATPVEHLKKVWRHLPELRPQVVKVIPSLATPDADQLRAYIEYQETQVA